MKRNKTKLTRSQLRKMLEYAKGLTFPNKQKKDDLKFLFHPLTPNDIYVKYTSYSLEPDNSVESVIKLICISPNGNLRGCEQDFQTLSQRMEFESGFIEVDLDANANLIFV